MQGDRKFTYDARGNLIEERRGKGGKLTTKYHYNLANQLVRVEKDGQSTDYRYDPLGRRIAKEDAFGTTQYLWAGDQMVQETRNHQKKTYLYEPESFRPLALVQDGEIYHYHLDHLGTPRELTNQGGDIVWKARYQTYGNVAIKEVDEIDNPIRFQGQYFDEETGLHYNRHRYYNPSTGQFTTQDPIGLLGGTNSYQYAPNPIQWVDPLGLSCKEVDFYVGPSGADSTLPATGYRYMKYKDADGTVNKHAKDAIKTSEARLSYFGFDNFDTGDEVTDAFQVRAPKHVSKADPDPAWSDGRLRLEFDTLQLYENGSPNVAVPYSHGGTGSDLEPFTTAYPQYGKGGARQLAPKNTTYINARKVEILPEK